MAEGRRGHQLMRVRTTTIGAYSKPAGVPVPAGFDVDRGRWCSTVTHEPVGGREDAAIDQAVREVVREQVDIGIDVPTDGELRREHYLWYHLRHLAGFDFTRLAPKVMRDGGWVDSVPVVRAPISAGQPFLVRDWQVAQSATDRPVKMTVPGPLTVVASTADGFYGDERALATAVADALNVEILRLAAAGCRHIQVDEPVFARQPAEALAYGIELLERCFHGLPDGVDRTVHICCGYPSTLDEVDYPKADPGSYLLLADALDAAAFDAVSIEDAHRHVDLGLLERFASTTVVLGVLDIASTRVERVEEIRGRLVEALEHIDGERLVAGPDCGLVMLGHTLAVAKLSAMVAAVHGLSG